MDKINIVQNPIRCVTIMWFQKVSRFYLYLLIVFNFIKPIAYCLSKEP